jgi:predicted nucleotidyltransferase
MGAERGDVAGQLGKHLEASPPSGLVSAYVFGSHAEGRAHRESDIDVGILLAHEAHPAPRDRFEVRVQLAASLPAPLGGAAVDIVVLNDAPPLLGRHIVTTGQRVFCADDGLDHAFVRDVQLRAADLEPFLCRMRRLKLEALAR